MSLDVYKDKRKEILSGRNRLSSIISAEDLIALDERLQLLDLLWTEVLEQVIQRRAQVQGRLERWSDFDEQCRRLTEAIAKCESAIEGNSEMTIEDLIVLLQIVSWSWICICSN